MTLIWHRQLKKCGTVPPRKKDASVRERLRLEAQVRGEEENVEQDEDENDDGELSQHLLDFIGK